MADTTADKVGVTIRHLRRGLKMSQEDLAAECGLTTTYVGMVERAETNVTLLALGKITKALNIKLSDLLIAVGE